MRPSDPLRVPFFRPDLGEEEIDEVVATLRSGWLTTGPRTQAFEVAFAEAVFGDAGETDTGHALAVNSCTAAMHLATAALGLGPGDAVLVPTMTFAATAEIVSYAGAVAVLVDGDPETLNLDLDDAARKLEALDRGEIPGARGARAVGMIPVHVGGELLAYDRLAAFAERHALWIVEDAAHAFPAAWRPDGSAPWTRCGDGPFAATCFSFYANKTITTGEGGMVTSRDADLLAHMRSLALHGLSTDAWGRYTARGAWDYRILEPGYKYNLTDVAAAIGLHQLKRAEAMRRAREAVAHAYREHLGDVEAVELPPFPDRRHLHSWHLFPIRLRLDRLAIDRDTFLEKLRRRGIGFSVHWRPLHLHPYYEKLGWTPEDLPAMSAEWRRRISLPIFPTMRAEEIEAVVTAVEEICTEHGR